ncbi:MAG: hypothetical protein PHU66_11230, partial [Bacteroidaceae bacterium]|nr:hypothetical protein [Bacteroidaceae bacterium]
MESTRTACVLMESGVALNAVCSGCWGCSVFLFKTDGKMSLTRNRMKTIPKKAYIKCFLRM